MELLKAIVAAAGSDWLLAFVVAVVFAGAVMVPVYRMNLGNRKAMREMTNQRERVLLDVIAGNSKAITENTAAVAGLKETLAREDVIRQGTLERIHERIDKIAEVTAQLQVAYNIARSDA
jgi:uncharacterized protein YfaA (DUF2138 family)